MSTPAAPPLEFVAHLSIAVGTPIDLGALPNGHRRMVPILGGTVAGPRLRGRVLPAGADHQYLRSDRVTELDARYAVETDDGARIAVHNIGLRVGSAADVAALLRDEPVDPNRIYFRTQPRLSTAHPDYAWLDDTLFVAAGERTPTTVELDVFAVR
ncbi:DUF3237 domain-containing protein [Williamsia maris]|uniref:UPF0311 protein LX13_002492 n=1 Tax=Williamsia maris TaxID=72806 RepID=A0ABT1HG53_9NOCA|nr:DUF3237 domain-containing protein [Williamsia maris]MCP2176673.1 Protein of unknown function (DUF3237) [Williamsia maris]